MAATIRMAREEDAADIWAIYAPIVQTTNCSFELTPPDEKDMRQRIVKTLDRMPWLSCDVDGVVRGYAYANPHRPRAAYQWSVEVSVYIDEHHRRRGIGRALYTSLFAILRLQGYFNAFAGISLPNQTGIHLHQSLGFTLVGTYSAVAFKREQWTDVSWWHLALREPVLDPEPPAQFAAVQVSSAWQQALAAGEPFLRL
ncbi:MAG: N-acetyltransferase [Chloroflexaceae bacterium]|nr:N-acetyltransferase [Chloroflexaceae bacterium]NJO06208.1 N-acetyltransferase [Chloroflexaceae bacterium]